MRIAAADGRQLISVISDTHGLLRPQALAALNAAQVIVHAGDIGDPQVLAALRGLAPVVAVRGNNDRGAWARRLPARVTLEIGALRLHVVHDVHDVMLDPAAAGIAVVIAGHSHRPLLEERNGVLFVNPGSAGPRRFSLPVSLAHLWIEGRSVRGTLVPLQV